MLNRFIKLLACIALFSSSQAMAALYEYSDGPGGFGNGGTFDSIETSYDSNSGVLTWEVNNALRNGSLMDGFWLVLNDGPNNPKGEDGLAIFYADFVDSDGAGTNDNIGLWAYEYNEQNNPNSYLQTEFLGDLSGGIIDENAGATRGFSVDVSAIYSQLSTPAPYDDAIGIWFHPNWGTESTVNSQGEITNWSYDYQSWYDRAGRPTTQVSEPGSFAIFSLGLLGLSMARRARKKS